MERETRLGRVRQDGTAVVIELHFTNEDYPMDFAGELRLEENGEVIQETQYEERVANQSETAEYELDIGDDELAGIYEVVLNAGTPTWGPEQTTEVAIEFEK